MTAAPIPAAPDLMTMLCRIGVGMREAVPSGVVMQFLVIGAMCPRFGAMLQAWLFVEERLVAGSAFDDAGLVDDGDCDAAVRSGWLSREGPVWRWRQVTRFGSVLVIPILWFVRCDPVRGLRLASLDCVAGIAAVRGFTFGGFVFRTGLAAG